MKQYRKASHSVYDLKYHIVWITKYRKPVLTKEIGTRVRDLVRMICASLAVEIVKGNVSRDHVHLLVSVPPTLSVTRLVQRTKGLTSRRLLQENRGLNKVYWGRPLWGRGYFVASVGNVSEQMIAAYIENQQEMERTADADFKVEP
jgi:putative transposase